MRKNLRWPSLAMCITMLPIMGGCTFLSNLSTKGTELNLDGYQLVFEDEFEGDQLNLDLWEYTRSGRRNGGFFHPDQVSVKDGNLKITAEWTENKYGEGWYSGCIKTKADYKYGYYEIRCICNAENDFWSAFWITCEGVYLHDVSQGGVYGAEIDIFETYKNKDYSKKDKIFSSIHCNGGDDNVEEIDSKKITESKIENLTTEYNTFGLMWTEEEYIFYANGKETGRTSFAKGASSVLEYVLVTLCIPDEITLDKSETSTFLVDSVKIYEKTK